MRIKNSFDAADLALCLAHGDAVDEANEARALLRWSDAYAPLAQINLTVRAFEVGVHTPPGLPLPPSYWDDLEEMWPSVPQAPTGDAYVSAKQPDQAEVWHSEPPAVAGVYVASAFRNATMLRWFDGSNWHIESVSNANSTEAARRTVVEATSYKARIEWLRLVQADKPAETAAPAATRSVCIKAHINAAGVLNKVGHVIAVSPHCVLTFPDCWLPCDEYGFVSHTPTAGSVCPVPVGVTAEAKWRKGLIACARTVGTWGSFHNATCEIVAWRPTGEAA